jgi:anti-sigma factor RsiW
MALGSLMRFFRRSDPREEELAALADGSLSPERRAAVEELLEGSPELVARLEEQERAVAVIRSAADTVEAPAALRAQIEAQRRPRPTTTHARRRYAWAGGLAVAAVAAVALALVLTLPENVPGGPSVAEGAVVATRPATAPPPQASSSTLLARNVEGVPFPNWAKKYGWKATGIRVDTLGGRRLTTVFYEKGARRIGYTIVAGSALKAPPGALRVRREGTELRLLAVDGRRVVTWQRRGRTCILSGVGMDAPTLTKLAAWNGQGTVPF